MEPGPGRSAVQQVIAAMGEDPPAVHRNAPTGVWSAAGDCLQFLAEHVTPETRSLETGCGASTVVFAATGAQHTSVFLIESEGEGVRDWCARHDVSTDRVTFSPGSSSEVLPRLEPGELDLVMIDGCHGFPFPQVDWYYAAVHLRDGGILIVDDTQLAAPYELKRFLDHDPRWDNLHVGSQWVAYRRRGSGSLDEEWTSQPFYQPLGVRVQTAKRRTRGYLGRLKRRVLGRG